MKKKALCIFTLIFWMLIACTLLSIKVEEQMIPQVTMVSAQMSGDYSSATIPLDCLSLDENGMHLYTTYEGTGWEAGLRVQEVESGSYEMEEGAIKLSSAWGEYIQYFSKPLKLGELVEVKRAGEKLEDHWLAVFSEEKPDFSELPEGVTLEEENDSAVLLQVEEAQQPYMDGRTKSVVPQLYDGRVYSFLEMQKFLDNLPHVGLVFGIVLAAVTLWICSCFMAKDVKKHRVGLIVNIVLGFALLFGLHLALGAIQLPSSMLPKEKITDFGYFLQEYNQFFDALKSFAPPASAVGRLEANLPETVAAQEIIHYKNITILRPFLFMALGVIIPLIMRFLEWAILYKRSLPKIK